jgi:hypothetical protein
VSNVQEVSSAAPAGLSDGYVWAGTVEPDTHTALDDRQATRAFERVPPQDLFAEQSVLGSMLISKDAIPAVAEIITREDYYRPAHALIHAAILDLHQHGEPADPITVTGELTKRGELTRAGGPGYLHTLANDIPTAVNADYHAEIVHERAVLRRLVEAGTRIAGMGYAAEGDLDEVVTAAQGELQAVTEKRRIVSGTGPAHLLASILQWQPLFDTDFDNVRLLPGQLLAPGEQIALVGDGKAGKSLFAQEWTWRMATARAFLGDTPQAAIRILYLDAENGRPQIQTRFRSFGADPDDMGTLVYASFPPIRPLDTPGGGQDLLALAQATGAELVVIDTVSRFIQGAENDADTWLGLYRHTLIPLKAAGVASVRLDHFGKDATKGARGNSAKTQDVDHVWELSAQGGGILSLKRTHTRTGIGPDSFTLIRHARKNGTQWVPGETRHEVMHAEDRAALIENSPEWIAAQLDAESQPVQWGSPKVAAWCAEKGIKVAKSKIEEAVRIRKRRPSGDLPRDLPYSSVTTTPPDAGGGTHKTPGQTSPGEVQGTPGDVPTAPPSPRLPSQEGGGECAPGTSTPPCTFCGHPLDPNWQTEDRDQHRVCDIE